MLVGNPVKKNHHSMPIVMETRDCQLNTDFACISFPISDSIFLMDIFLSFCSTPGGNTISAAEQTCVLISSLARYDIGCSQVVCSCQMFVVNPIVSGLL